MYFIYLRNIEELIEKRKKQGPVVVANYISSSMKSARLKSDLTLFDITNGICSEAFLSKLERNLMDPHNERVPLLCERLNLDYDTLVNLDSNDRIEKLLEYYINEKYDDILEMNDSSCEGVFIAQDEIIKAYKSLIKNDYKSVQMYVISLDNVKECLSDFELFTLLLLVYKCYFNSMQYKKASQYIEILKCFDFKNEKIALYIEEIDFILNCKINSYNVNDLFENIKKKFQCWNLNKQILFIIMHNETLSDEKSYNYLIDIGKNYIPEQYKDEYNYAIGLILTKLNKPVEAMKHIMTVSNLTFRFIALYAYNLYLYKNSQENKEFKNYKAKLISLIKICNQYSSDTYHIAFLRLIQYEIDESSPDIICNYIKNQFKKELSDYNYPLYD